MHALVTGAAGFIGSHIVEQLLARGDRVRALVRRPAPELHSRGVEIVQADIRDAAAVRNACMSVDVVFHVAGVAGIWGPWDHYYTINTLGTRNVIEGCRANGVRRLVFTSSPSVTFDGSAQEGVDEHVPYSKRWLCHYAHTKSLAEQEVLAANGPNLSTCALRPHLVWGPGDQQLVPRLIARAKAGSLRQVGDGTNLIDSVYVENAAIAHLQAADAVQPNSPVAGRAYFITQGEPVNCWRWINRLLSLASVPAVSRAISTETAWQLGAVLEMLYGTLRIRREPPMTRFLAAQLGRSHYYDISRACRDFGYKPLISVDEGLSRLAESWVCGNPDTRRSEILR